MCKVKPLLYFRYKDEDIYLENIHNPQNENQKEFEKLIEDLNIEFSYKGILDKGVENVPIEIVYKGTTMVFADLISDYEVIDAKLKDVDYIDGVESKLGIAKGLFLALSSFANKSDQHIIYFETARMLQDLFNTLIASKYSLLQSVHKLQCSNITIWNTPAEWHFLIRSTHLNNAILGYNSAFDLLLQSIWLNKRLYKKFSIRKNDRCFCTSDLLNENRDNLLKQCTLPNIIKDEKYNLFKTFINSYNIRNYANLLKHKGRMRYKEYYPLANSKMIFGRVDYTSLLDLKDIDSIIDEVIDYHVAFCEFVQKVYDDFLKSTIEEPIKYPTEERQGGIKIGGNNSEKKK